MYDVRDLVGKQSPAFSRPWPIVNRIEVDIRPASECPGCQPPRSRISARAGVDTDGVEGRAPRDGQVTTLGLRQDHALASASPDERLDVSGRVGSRVVGAPMGAWPAGGL